MGSEDFGAFARAVPGCFTFLGNGTERGRRRNPTAQPRLRLQRPSTHRRRRFLHRSHTPRTRENRLSRRSPNPHWSTSRPSDRRACGERTRLPLGVGPTLADVDATAARRWFGDALVAYDWRDRDARDLVAASAEMLALGVDGEALVALASKVVTPLTSPFEMDALIADARAEMRMRRLDDSAATVRFTRSQLRRWARGELSDRQLTRWAHAAVGHDGPEELQDLVVMDDLLDEWEGARSAPTTMHRDLVRIAGFIMEIPDPWE